MQCIHILALSCPCPCPLSDLGPQASEDGRWKRVYIPIPLYLQKLCLGLISTLLFSWLVIDDSRNEPLLLTCFRLVFLTWKSQLHRLPQKFVCIHIYAHERECPLPTSSMYPPPPPSCNAVCAQLLYPHRNLVLFDLGRLYALTALFAKLSLYLGQGRSKLLQAKYINNIFCERPNFNNRQIC